MVPHAELITDLPGLERIRDGWDALAAELGRPFSSPAWTLAWWRHAAPSGAELRVIPTIWGHRVNNPVQNPADAQFVDDALRRLLGEA